MAIVNTVHKQAAKATIARMAIAGDHPDIIGLGVSEAAAELGLQLGNFGSQATMAKYAQGVKRNGERVCNRKWGSYPSQVAALSKKLEDQAVKEVDRILQ